MPEIALSLAGYLLMVAAAAVLLARGAFLADGPLAIAVQVAALALMLWARATFGRWSFQPTASPTAPALVTTGPYRYLRHPIYAAVLYAVWAGVLSHLAPVNVALGLVAGAGAALRIGTEERRLRERFPGYRDYARRTKRIVPFVL